MEEEYEEMEIISRIEYLYYNDTKNYLNNNSINEINNRNKKTVYISPDLIQYELIIEKDEKDQIIITIIEKNNKEFNKYQIILTLKDLNYLSPYFKLLSIINPILYIDSIFYFIRTQLNNDILKTNKHFFTINNNDFINLINMKKSNSHISHLNESNETIFFIFYINYCNLKREEIKIKLDKIESVEDEDYLKVIDILFRNKYNYIQRINTLKKKLRKTQKLAKKYEILLDKCNAYFGQNMTIKMEFLDMGIDTDILFSEKEYNFITKNISRKLKSNFSNLVQIYKASCNGDNINAFHLNCKNIPNTLILIITDEKRRFGGFTQAEWDESNKYKYDDKAFLFSLDNYEIYPILDQYKDKAINCREDFYAPIFGEDLFLFDGFFSSQLNKTKEKFYNYSKSKIEDEYKLSGQEYFTVTEMEVYQVIFSNK